MAIWFIGPMAVPPCISLRQLSAFSALSARQSYMPSASCSCIWTISGKKLASTFAGAKFPCCNANFFNFQNMSYKLSILFALAFMSCGQSSKLTDSVTTPTAAVVTDSIPAGFSVVEKQPDGYFIRLSSAERATPSAIRSLVDTFSGKFDRIDLCLDVAHERGDEYASIIGSQLFDYENDNIYTIKINSYAKK